VLRDNWEARSRSDARDFYVASHPGWDEAERWEAQAEADAELMLHAVDAEELATAHVLEVGCGVGRLARPLAARAASYTGIDISAGMVAEARIRLENVAAARFFVCDGLRVPEAACDRRYRQIVALAVLIHCPRDVVRSLVASAYELLEPGGQLRFQVLADPDDPTGIASLPAAEEVHQEMRDVELVVTPQMRELIDGHYYMGAKFRFDELEPFLLDAAGGGGVVLFRPDLVHVYGWIERPRGGD